MKTNFKNIPEHLIEDKAHVRLTLKDSHYEWYVLTAEQNGEDYKCFGYVNTLRPKYDYFSLKGLMTLGVEIDEEFQPQQMTPIAARLRKEYIKRECGL